MPLSCISRSELWQLSTIEGYVLIFLLIYLLNLFDGDCAFCNHCHKFARASPIISFGGQILQSGCMLSCTILFCSYGVCPQVYAPLVLALQMFVWDSF